MAQKSQVQYIRYYTDGSAARKLAPAVPQQEEIVQPRKRSAKPKVLYIDPLPAVAVLLACCMVLLMAVGVVKLMQARAEVAAMEAYVDRLSAQNAELSDKYHKGYDLDRIRQTALALDMVPAQQVQTHTLQLPAEPAQPEQITLWQQIGTFLSALFA